jgi:hypothetical protein
MSELFRFSLRVSLFRSTEDDVLTDYTTGALSPDKYDEAAEAFQRLFCNDAPRVNRMLRHGIPVVANGTALLQLPRIPHSAFYVRTLEPVVATRNGIILPPHIAEVLGGGKTITSGQAMTCTPLLLEPRDHGIETVSFELYVAPPKDLQSRGPLVLHIDDIIEVARNQLCDRWLQNGQFLVLLVPVYDRGHAVRACEKATDPLMQQRVINSTRVRLGITIGGIRAPETKVDDVVPPAVAGRSRRKAIPPFGVFQRDTRVSLTMDSVDLRIIAQGPSVGMALTARLNARQALPGDAKTQLQHAGQSASTSDTGTTGTTDMSGASVVTVSPGREVSGVESPVEAAAYYADAPSLEDTDYRFDDHSLDDDDDDDDDDFVNVNDITQPFLDPYYCQPPQFASIPPIESSRGGAGGGAV